MPTESTRNGASWEGFRRFRRQRPFWAGVFTLLSGLILLFPPYASLKFGDAVISLNTMGGISSLVIGVVMIACAISFWSRPEFKVPASVVTMILALVAIVTSNLGSFLVGTLLGVIGAALGFAWSPKDGRRWTKPAAAPETTAELEPVDRPAEETAPGMAGSNVQQSNVHKTRRRHINRPHGAGA